MGGSCSRRWEQLHVDWRHRWCIHGFRPCFGNGFIAITRIIRTRTRPSSCWTFMPARTPMISIALGEAPLTLALTMVPTALPGEHLKIYGLSGGNVEERAGGMSALAMDGSNAFFREFTILAIANTSTVGGGLEQFRSAGRYRTRRRCFRDRSLLALHDRSGPPSRPFFTFSARRPRGWCAGAAGIARLRAKGD